MIKNIAGNNTTINCDYSDDVIIPSNGYSNVNSVTIGAGSCIFVSQLPPPKGMGLRGLNKMKDFRGYNSIVINE